MPESHSPISQNRDTWDRYYSDSPRMRYPDLTFVHLLHRYALKHPPLRKGLCIGCGDGPKAFAAAQAGIRMTCLDISPNAVERINRFSKEDGFGDMVLARGREGDFRNPESPATGGLLHRAHRIHRKHRLLPGRGRAGGRANLSHARSVEDGPLRSHHLLLHGEGSASAPGRLSRREPRPFLHRHPPGHGTSGRALDVPCLEGGLKMKAIEWDRWQGCHLADFGKLAAEGRGLSSSILGCDVVLIRGFFPKAWGLLDSGPPGKPDANRTLGQARRRGLFPAGLSPRGRCDCPGSELCMEGYRRQVGDACSHPEVRPPVVLLKPWSEQ